MGRAERPRTNKQNGVFARRPGVSPVTGGKIGAPVPQRMAGRIVATSPARAATAWLTTPLGRTIVWSAVACAALLMLLAPALWNGYPLLQWDTGGYLARWFEGYLVPSRAGAYGLFLAAAIPFDFWSAVAIQAGLALWIVVLLFRVHDLPRRPLSILLAIAALSLTTALPLLASLLLTDIFAGLAVLALYLLVFASDRLGRFTHSCLMLLVAAAAATHSATFGLLALLALSAFCARWLDPARFPAAGARRAGFAVLLGVVLTFVGNFAVSKQWSWTPGGYGIVFGRMLEDGIVKRYLDDHCPNPRLKLCPHRNTMPQAADEFLWGTSVFNDLGRFAGLEAEMRTIVLGSLAKYPALQIRTAAIATWTQLFSVASGEGMLDTIWHTYGIAERYVPSVLPAMRAARQQHGELDFRVVNMIHVPVAILAMLALPLMAWFGLRDPAWSRIGMLAAAAALALLANAAICGILSNPHDRYGARLAWIAPLVLIVAAFRLVEARQARRHAANPQDGPC
jgi:hypothetical protein